MSVLHLKLLRLKAHVEHTCFRNVRFPLSLQPRRNVPKRNSLPIKFGSFVDIITSQQSSTTRSDSADMALYLRAKRRDVSISLGIGRQAVRERCNEV